jgi:hypothetical protein
MSTDRKRDDDVAARYEDPDMHEPTGPAVRRHGDARLQSHVPVRFPVETINRVRYLADREGVTVSAWIRSVVTREVQRQMRSPSVTGLSSNVEAFVTDAQWQTTTSRDEDERPAAELPSVATGG